jgi:hypothetical protein
MAAMAVAVKEVAKEGGDWGGAMEVAVMGAAMGEEGMGAGGG